MKKENRSVLSTCEPSHRPGLIDFTGKEYTLLSRKQAEQRIIDSGMKPHTCPMCGKIFGVPAGVETILYDERRKTFASMLCSSCQGPLKKRAINRKREDGGEI